MAPDISICHKQQFCGWDIAHTRLATPGTIHVVSWLYVPRYQSTGIFASNVYRMSRYHPQMLLQKRQDVIMPEYPQILCVIISCHLHCMPNDRIEAPSWIGSGVLQGSTGLRYKAFPFSTASHRISLDKMRSLHCPGQCFHCPAPHRASTRDLTYCQIVQVTSFQKPWCSFTGNPGGLGWHSTGMSYLSEPIRAE